jgi:histidine ammonia-lyase
LDFELDGNSLTIAAFKDIVCGARRVSLAGEARERMRQTRATVERLAASDSPVYGVTTGFGLLADRHIGPDDLRELQVNLVRSHAAGVGDPLNERETRGMLLLRANVLAKGYSGARPEIADLLCEMLNHRVHPVIPCRGSVGASGDLAPLAHLALVAIGEGEAVYNGQRMTGSQALSRAGLTPVQLGAKEGLALLNGTQAMLSLGLLALIEATDLCDSADVIGALTLDALRGTPTAFDPRLHDWARPHPGQIASAANLRRLNAGSEIRESHRTGDTRVQDAYSLRCMPQVHGAVRDVLAHVRSVFEVEMNSATDNPLVFGEEVLSGGNFHGQPVAFALDYLAIGLSALAGVSERRIERMVNPALSEGLPPFLAARPGLDSGLMIAQITAAALVSENKVLSHPASVDSITTSGNKEDYVSMGMAGALKIRQVVENTRHVLAIEAICAAQALDGNPHRTSPLGERARKIIRENVAHLGADRPLAPDIAAAASLIAAGALARLLLLTE